MADARDSKSRLGNQVRVRVPPPAEHKAPQVNDLRGSLLDRDSASQTLAVLRQRNRRGTLPVRQVNPHLLGQLAQRGVHVRPTDRPGLARRIVSFRWACVAAILGAGRRGAAESPVHQACSQRVISGRCGQAPRGGPWSCRRARASPGSSRASTPQGTRTSLQRDAATR